MFCVASTGSALVKSYSTNVFAPVAAYACVCTNVPGADVPP